MKIHPFLSRRRTLTPQNRCSTTIGLLIISLQFIRWFISSISYLWKLLSQNETNPPSSALKSRPSQKDASKNDKTKKEVEVAEECEWKPWSLIWPKEGSKSNAIPVVNTCGKYAVKLHWMVRIFKRNSDITIVRFSGAFYAIILVLITQTF